MDYADNDDGAESDDDDIHHNTDGRYDDQGW